MITKRVFRNLVFNSIQESLDINGGHYGRQNEDNGW